MGNQSVGYIYKAGFGVLVTSSNNTAVENITKELPLEKGILDNLKIVSDGNMPDSPEKAQQLRTICKMFSTSETEKKLNVYQKDTKRQGEYPEIYFTGYAKKFFGNAEKDADAWGMVAAPLLVLPMITERIILIGLDVRCLYIEGVFLLCMKYRIVFHTMEL